MFQPHGPSRKRSLTASGPARGQSFLCTAMTCGSNSLSMSRRIEGQKPETA